MDLVTLEWRKQFPVANQASLAKRGSDHRPVLIRLLSSQDEYRGSFRFDKRFLHKPLIKETVAQAWNCSHASGGNGVSDKLRAYRKALSKWKRLNNFNSLDRIQVLQSELEILQSSSYPCLRQMWYLKKKLVEAYREEESFWNPKCREKWLKEGDRNTKFFHDSVKANRVRNCVETLLDLVETFRDPRYQKEKWQSLILKTF